MIIVSASPSDYPERLAGRKRFHADKGRALASSEGGAPHEHERNARPKGKP